MHKCCLKHFASPDVSGEHRAVNWTPALSALMCNLQWCWFCERKCDLSLYTRDGFLLFWPLVGCRGYTTALFVKMLCLFFCCAIQLLGFHSPWPAASAVCHFSLASADLLSLLLAPSEMFLSRVVNKMFSSVPVLLLLPQIERRLPDLLLAQHLSRELPWPCLRNR